MPTFLEHALATGAAKHGFTGKRAAHYIYGAMNNLGAMHGNQETAKGRRMDAKHAKDVKAGVAESQIRRAKPSERKRLEARKRKLDR